MRRLFWCNPVDVLDAFRVVSHEIRNKCRSYATTGMTQGEACELAGRVREQRELIRQLTDRRNIKHARRLMRLNCRLRKRVIALVASAGQDADVLIFK